MGNVSEASGCPYGRVSVVGRHVESREIKVMGMAVLPARAPPTSAAFERVDVIYVVVVAFTCKPLFAAHSPVCTMSVGT